MTLRSLIVWLLVGLLQWPWMLGLSVGRSLALEQHPALVFLTHGASALLCFLLLEPRGRGWWSHARGAARTSALFVLVFPVLGWIGLGCLLLARVRTAPSVHQLTLDDNTQTIIPTALSHDVGSHSERVLHELDIVPLADILVGTDLELKRSAVERLERLRTPEAIALLQQHRSAASPEVRFYVSAALDRIKRAYEETLDAGKFEVRQGDFKASARLYLARTYIECARLQLFDAPTTAMYCREAQFHLEAIVKGMHLQAKALWLLLELYEWQGAWRDAERTVMQLESQSESSQAALCEARARIAYAQGEYHALRRALKVRAHVSAVDPQWQALTQWWGVESS